MSLTKDHPKNGESTTIPFWRLAPALEFIFWIAVAICPMLYLVNGPSVTDDQAAIQIALVVMAVCGAIGLRIYNWCHAEHWRDFLESNVDCQN